MSDTPAAQVEAAAHPRSRRRRRRLAVVFTIMLLLFGVPWWTLLSAGTHWPAAVVILAGWQIHRHSEDRRLLLVRGACPRSAWR